MRLLLDTSILIWLLLDPSRLPKKALKMLSDEKNDCFFSSVSIWEIAIKQRTERIGFDGDANLIHRELLELGFEELLLTSAHGLRTLNLPPFHRDPFDRILIAQALTENLAFLTSDKIIAQYPGNILKV